MDHFLGLISPFYRKVAEKITCLHSTMTTKTALILGVANHRSIAWACVKSLLEHGDYRVVFTYQNERFERTANDLIAILPEPWRAQALPCNVETDLPTLFQQQLPEILSLDSPQLDAIIHSVAYAPPDAMGAGGLISTTRQAFVQAHTVSAYSLLETTRLALPLLRSTGASITTLSYLGAVRAVPNYNVMGPAKASLEALVRGLALEIAPHCINAVSAGPLNTIAARGISGITDIRHHVEQTAPLKRNVTTDEVANVVRFVATQATGMTGQVITIDAGYSSIVPIDR
jgi:enoyl-[acyl-carrier protein] reductase I